MMGFCTRNIVAFLKWVPPRQLRGIGLELAFNDIFNIHFPIFWTFWSSADRRSRKNRWLTATRGSTTSMASFAFWLLGCGISHGMAMVKNQQLMKHFLSHEIVWYLVWTCLNMFDSYQDPCKPNVSVLSDWVTVLCGGIRISKSAVKHALEKAVPRLPLEATSTIRKPYGGLLLKYSTWLAPQMCVPIIATHQLPRRAGRKKAHDVHRFNLKLVWICLDDDSYQ